MITFKTSTPTTEEFINWKNRKEGKEEEKWDEWV